MGQLAKASGRKVSGDVERALEDTLRAVLADPKSAGALAAGRLTEGMQNTGFGGPVHADRDERPTRLVEKVTATAIPATTGQPSPLERTRAERAEQLVNQAKSAADKAAPARQKAQDLLDGAQQTTAHAEARSERLHRELEETLQARAKAEKDQQRAQAAFDRAGRGAQDAQQRLADAIESQIRLGP